MQETLDGAPVTVNGVESQIAEWREKFPLRYDWDDDVIKPVR